jgi:hypothetical protein
MGNLLREADLSAGLAVKLRAVSTDEQVLTTFVAG